MMLVRRRRAGASPASPRPSRAAVAGSGTCDTNELVVGVMNDADMAAYKRPPVMTMAERIAVIAACRYVDRVVPDAPTRPTPAFLDALGIAIVCHGDDYAEHQVEDYYGAIRATHRLVLLPYTPSVSTSEIIARIRRQPV